jgi:hypothetical protein
MITTINPSSSFIAMSKYREEHGENVMVGLDSRADAAIHWVMAKMEEEARIADLAETNPSVADAVLAVKQAEEQLKIVMALVE